MRNLLLFFILVSITSYSQEVLSDPSYNPVVAEKWQQLQMQQSSFKTTSALDTIDINTKPFLDDFSLNSVYPDTAWWIDQYVYINRDYPIAPVTVGVATFEGLDASGLPYDWTIQEPNTREADKLTSKAINLGSPLTSGDSIYLSFYYQARGHGEAPEAKDSLVLEFRSPTKDWSRVWYKNGYTPTDPDTSFHQVMIAITDTALYLKNGFQFRFKNYATLSGNIDHWHVDYVYLNKSRNMNDTIREDVALVYSPPSLLNEYQAMPWEQYSTTETKTGIQMFMRNNMNSPKNTNYKYFIKDNSGTVLNTYDGGSTNVNTFETGGYNNYSAHASPVVSYSFPALNDTATFFVEHRLITTPDEDTLNNKIIFPQKFHNYYAYDDGTCEKAYVVFSTQFYSYVANKFNLNVNDTLKAILVFFNPAYEKVDQAGTKPLPIKIMVWDDNNGVPGNIIYQADTVVYSVYEPGHNSFHTFKIDTAGIALNSGAFYVGWQQINTFGSNAPKIRIGFDVNTNSKNKTFYDLSGTGTTWTASTVNGSLMIRPVMKEIYSSSGIENNSNKVKAQLIEIYPNPANEYIHLNSATTFDVKQFIIIYDIFGRNILEERIQRYPKTINTSDLADGIYLVKIQDKNQKTSQVTKLIVVH